MALSSVQLVAWCIQGVLAVLGAYLLQLFVRQRSLIFQGSREAIPPPRSLAKYIERVWLERPQGRLHGWWVAGSPDAHRTILLLPGAIGNFSHEVSTIEFARSIGAGVLAIDYPGYGMSQGRSTERGVYEAAECGWQFLVNEKRIPASEVVIWGRSLGAIAAIRLAAAVPCRGLVVHNGFLSIPDVAADRYPFFPVRPFCLLKFDAREAVKRVGCPTLFLHARGDTAIPTRLGRRCFQLVTAPKQFLEVPGTHGGDAWAYAVGVRQSVEELWSGLAACWN